jgi:predicted amidohydrolase YtcJ
LGINPSFFPVHLYYWGDKHYNIFLGPTRANRMNPVKSALTRNLKYTLHNDSPIVRAGIVNGVNTFIKIISSAVNRVTASGRVLDDAANSQKIGVYDALKGLTINGAWQAHEEATKGSIAVGKNADLLVLNYNPLTIKESDLDTVQVEATIKGGELVFGAYPMMG